MHSNFELNVDFYSGDNNVDTPLSSFSKMSVHMKACVYLQFLRPKEGSWGRGGGVPTIVNYCLGYIAHSIYFQCASVSFREQG